VLCGEGGRTKLPHDFLHILSILADNMYCDHLILRAEASLPLHISENAAKPFFE